MKEHVYGVNHGIDHYKSNISVFKAIYGYIKCFQQRGFWWYQESLINWSSMYVFWQ